MEPSKVLCVTSYFPPVAVSGTHRIRAMVRHISAFGWRPVVVTMPLRANAPRDEALLEGIPTDLAVYRPPAPMLLDLAGKLRPRRRPAASSTSTAASEPVPARPTFARRFVDWASWWLQVPCLATGWLPGGTAAACWVATEHHCRAIYTTAPYWTTHLIGLLTQALTGLPWVADFRDPWRANPFREIPYKSVDRFDAWLERRVVRSADRVICNTEAVRRDFESRFPDRVGRFVTIPNGFDPEDFLDLEPRRFEPTDRLVLTHAGAFYGRRSPEPIFRAIHLLKERAGAPAPRLQLVGPTTYEGQDLEELAARHGIADQVLLTGPVDHHQALELMKGSDIQVLVGFGGPGAELQIPAKLFEYMGVGRPILAMAPEHGAIGEVLRQSGVHGELCDPEDPERIAAAITRLTAGRPSLAASPDPDGLGVSRFHRRFQVHRIAETLEEARHERG